MTSSRWKVLVAIPVLLVGGTEVQTLHLVRVLVGAGYRVTVCCYYEHEESMVAAMRVTGADVLLMELNRADGLLNLAARLSRLFRDLGPDIVHVQYVAPGFVPIVGARLAGVKKVLATVHQPGRTHGWKERLILRSAARLCTLFFCVSRSAEESWFGDSALFDQELYKKGRRHFTLYNAVDTERIARASGSEDVETLCTALGLRGKRVVGYVGRLRWEKGPEVLVEAFARVVKEVPEAVLLMVGDGPDRESLGERAKCLGIDDKIIWMGQKPQEEVFRLYGLMDILAMPSFFEGFGLTAAEAMAAGVPVVASNVDGLNELVIGNITGLVFPTGNTEKLSACMAKLLVQGELRVSIIEKARQFIVKSFDLSSFERNILGVYDSFQLDCR